MVQLHTVSASARNQQQACNLQKTTMTSMVTLLAGSLPTENTPAPLYLVTVLDKSGSMAGSKLDMLKDTVKRLIAKLRPVDTLTIITYDTNVSTMLPPTLMTEENASNATELVEKLRTGSSTNLSGGLVEGLNCIPSDLPPNTVVSTLLLTDGHANHGVTNSAGIISLMNHTWDKDDAPSKSAVYTFGYGSDHNSGMLRDISEAGNGMYYYIENGDRIADCFADVLGGLFSVVAQNLVVTLEAQGDVTINEVYTEYSTTEVNPGKKLRIQLADIQSEESRDIPLNLTVPATSSECEMPLLKVVLEYFDSITNEVCSHDATLTIPRVSELSEDQQKLDVEIDGHVNRVQTCAVLKAAKQLGDNNKCEEGRKMLSDQIAKIQESVSADLPLCARLIKDLNVAKEAMVSYQRYVTDGSHRISNFKESHSRQRAAPQGYEEEFSGFTYVNAARFDMQSMY